MSTILVWLDTTQARLFHLKPQTIHVENFNYHGHKHPAESLGINHPKHQTDEEVFYHQLAANLEKSPATKLLLMGPSLGPKHFMQHLKNHHPLIAEKVIGVQKVDQMPDADILSTGRRFLHQYYLYNGAS